jgi:inner membrane protein
MENVAHAFAGLLVADAVVAWRNRREPRCDPRFPWLAAVTSAVANNVADGDLVLTGLTGGKLGYLMHHRGHTHTLIVGVALGLLVALAVVAISRRRSGPLTRADSGWLLGLGAAGPVIHIGMDAWNVYGVHPFWPWDDAWYYGDAVFIVEPLLWLAAIPSLMLASRARWARFMLGAIAALGCILPWLQPQFVPFALRLGLLAFGILIAVVVWRARAAMRPAIGLIAFAAVPTVFLVTSAKVRTDVEAQLAVQFPGETLHDVALTARPVSPLCWMGISVSTEPGGDFILRRLVASASPALVSALDCPSRAEEATAPLRPVSAADDARLRYEGEVRERLARLRTLAAENCEVAAMLRFTRAPFIVDRDGGLWMGDLRFDNRESADFAEVEIALQPARCPRFVPSWIPPRSDLLSAPGK